MPYPSHPPGIYVPEARSKAAITITMVPHHAPVRTALNHPPPIYIIYVLQTRTPEGKLREPHGIAALHQGAVLLAAGKATEAAVQVGGRAHNA